MSASTSLPVVDLSKAADVTARDDVARQLAQALKTVGFLYLDNVPDLDLDSLLEDTKWFFSLPEQTRLSLARKQWNPSSPNYYRGYFPLQPGEISYKEGFEMCQEQNVEAGRKAGVHPLFLERNLWPQGSDRAERFRTNMERNFQALLRAGTEVLRLLCRGCGMEGEEEDWFQPLLSPDSLSTFRLLHYPPRPSDPPVQARDGDAVLCCSEHTDSGFVTLLATFAFGGLQIRDKDGYWLDVPPRPQSLVMNIGDMLSAMSGGQLKSTRHRVVDTGLDRYSVPFFFEPRFAADVSRVMPTAVAKDAPRSLDDVSVLYGPWVLARMLEFAEFREMLNMFNADNNTVRGT